MSAADEIQAAIDKLTRRRSESEEHDGPREWRARQIAPLDQADVLDDADNVIAERIFRPDADLIAMLHATIDPQMAILEAAVGGGHDDPTAVACAFVLAEAINGATS